MSLTSSISSKFSLYDQVGYLLVGSVLLLLVSFDVWAASGTMDLPSFSIESILIWIVVAYLSGHIVQSIANILVRENKDNFSESHQRVLADVRNYFGYPEWNDRDAFKHCYVFVCAKDLPGHVTSFNAYYSLYRGWVVLFLLQSLFLVTVLTMDGFSWRVAGLLFGFVALSALIWLRKRRYWNYVTDRTLETFVILRKLGE